MMADRAIGALSSGSFSARGARARNEDAVYSGDSVLVVCDGVGGAEFGDAMAAAALKAYLEASGAGLCPRDALGRANDAVRTVKGLTGSEGGGSTIVAAQVREGLLTVVWTGDSAAFLVRGGAAMEVASPQRDGAFLRGGLGYRMAIEPLSAEEELKPGDCVVLCTDGVWACVGPEEMVSIVGGARGNAPRAARLLSELGASRDGDNATAAVMYLGERC